MTMGKSIQANGREFNFKMNLFGVGIVVTQNVLSHMKKTILIVSYMRAIEMEEICISIRISVVPYCLIFAGECGKSLTKVDVKAIKRKNIFRWRQA